MIIKFWIIYFSISQSLFIKWTSFSLDHIAFCSGRAFRHPVLTAKSVSVLGKSNFSTESDWSCHFSQLSLLCASRLRLNKSENFKTGSKTPRIDRNIGKLSREIVNNRSEKLNSGQKRPWENLWGFSQEEFRWRICFVGEFDLPGYFQIKKC